MCQVSFLSEVTPIYLSLLDHGIEEFSTVISVSSSQPLASFVKTPPKFWYQLSLILHLMQYWNGKPYHYIIQSWTMQNTLAFSIAIENMVDFVPLIMVLIWGKVNIKGLGSIKSDDASGSSTSKFWFYMMSQPSLNNWWFVECPWQKRNCSSKISFSLLVLCVLKLCLIFR